MVFGVILIFASFGSATRGFLFFDCYVCYHNRLIKVRGSTGIHGFPPRLDGESTDDDLHRQLQYSDA